MIKEAEKLMSEVIDDLEKEKKSKNEEQLLIQFLESLMNEQISHHTGGEQ
jgi:hypothetical protein